ncbi:acyl-coenzyme A thioesterase 1-like isoform X5 [Perognathus longimembris pacificus]|nr:acyl-coenzyme A thioesterase 1-like isoform X5 [Perognathus longimembris pacificus]
MGLLWAMQPDRPFWRLVKRDVQTPLQVELEVLDDREPHEPAGPEPEPQESAGPEGGRVLARAVHERHFMAAGVRRVPVREGRVRATLFLPPGPGPFPGIIDLFGVGGGLLEYRASLLAGKGFAVMALAYYNYDDLPKDMKLLHLEYFVEAMNYLLRHPQVKGPGIGLLGTSKGGQICLSMAAFLKGITAAVIINGSVANAGGTLCYKDETLPPLGFNRNRLKIAEDGIANTLDTLNSPLEGPDQKSFIPVERSDTTFLFLVGQDDQSWKSEFYANEASKRLEAHGKEKPQIISYPDTGHNIEPPYFPLSKVAMHQLWKCLVTFGGETRAHAIAQVDAWKQLQIFFRKHLCGTKDLSPAKL